LKNFGLFSFRGVSNAVSPISCGWFIKGRWIGAHQSGAGEWSNIIEAAAGDGGPL
jgi:hypothetical protein